MLHNQTHANVLDTYIVQYACTVYILSTKLKESQELSRSSTIFFSLRGHSSITSSKSWVVGVRKWQFLMIYITANHQRCGLVGLKK